MELMVIGLLMMIFITGFGFYRGFKRMQQSDYGIFLILKCTTVGAFMLLMLVFISTSDKSLIILLIIIAMFFIFFTVLEEFLRARELKRMKVMQYNKNMENWK